MLIRASINVSPSPNLQLGEGVGMSARFNMIGMRSRALPYPASGLVVCGHVQ